MSSKIGEEQTSDDAEDGPPELLVRIGVIIRKIHVLFCSSFMVVIRQKSPTFHGIQLNPGSSVQYQKII